MKTFQLTQMKMHLHVIEEMHNLCTDSAYGVVYNMRQSDLMKYLSFYCNKYCLLGGNLMSKTVTFQN